MTYKPKRLCIAAQYDANAPNGSTDTMFDPVPIDSAEAETFTYYVEGRDMCAELDNRSTAELNDIDAFNARAWGDESPTAVDAVLKAHAKYPDAEIVVPPVALRDLMRKPAALISAVYDAPSPNHRLAFLSGFEDGLESPKDLTFGMTYEGDATLQAAYDYGCNMGQSVGRALGNDTAGLEIVTLCCTARKGLVPRDQPL